MLSYGAHVLQGLHNIKYGKIEEGEYLKDGKLQSKTKKSRVEQGASTIGRIKVEGTWFWEIGLLEWYYREKIV